MSQPPTTEVRAGHEFVVANLESNPTFMLTSANGAKYVMRKKPPGALISKSAHQVDREYRVIKALKENTSLPMPQAVCYCSDTKVVGTEFYVMVFCEGRVIADNMLLSLPKSERRLYWKAIMDTLAAFHKVDHHAVGLGDYGKSGGYYTRQITNFFRLSEDQAKVTDKAGKAVGHLPGFEDMRAWFKKNIVKDEVSLFHGDYKPDNLIMHPTKPIVLAILDWELSTVGHPLADLAHLLLPFYTSEMPSSYDGKAETTTKLDIDPPVEELIKMYCVAANRPYPIPGWNFCVAFAIFRMAVIMQGIAGRYALGQASNPAAQAIGARVPQYTQFALRLIESAPKL
ncbi:hypothetical protein SmJEL517_g01324 [Synchytrium microbalum]|uniref:Aminoglycoside phosphotransferase domain-containing protein n=1 Tax=Synchytrium microbalum TaxID=1806994 RepID=A0A507CF73_9FUNG|nr:uncharacterized protein SmJEL517_g01324 [Synchytrium microbalum]TPX36646.1 hypothetical protein SmJEL517_g01324 [Synchytrium microbalum]